MEALEETIDSFKHKNIKALTGLVLLEQACRRTHVSKLVGWFGAF